MYRLAALLTCAFAAWPQMVSLSGVVLNQATGAPIRRAQVTLATPGRELSAVEITDSEGRFTFRDIPAGSYRLFANREGFQGGLYGPRSWNSASSLITARSDRSDFVLRLNPLGSVSGTVLDDLGDPVPGAEVQLLFRTWDRGRPILSRSNGARTNDRGEYRLFHVQPGTYYIAAKSFAVAHSGEEQQGRAHAIQFWRGGETVLQGTPLVIAPGRDATGIDFRLQFARTGEISGVVSGLPEGAKDNFQVRLLAQDMPEIGSHTFGQRYDKDGKFSFWGILPGTYSVVATLEGGGVRMRGMTSVRIAGGEKLDVAVAMHPDAELQGTVQFSQPKQGLRVRLIPADRLPAFMRSSMSVNVNTDGSFRFQNIPAGTWDIAVDGLPETCYVQSMMLGRQNVLLEDMVIGPRVEGPLRIAISSTAAAVEVEAEGPAVVLLAPTGAHERILGFYDLQNTVAEGRATFQRVRPGSYRVYAFEELAPNEWQAPEFLKPFEGTPVTVKDGERAKVKVPLIRRQAP